MAGDKRKNGSNWSTIFRKLAKSSKNYIRFKTRKAILETHTVDTIPVFQY